MDRSFRKTIAHEAFHAVQAYVIEVYDQGIPHVVDGMLPHWFLEGSATWAAAIALDEWGLREYEESFSTHLVDGRAAGGELPQFETGSGWFKSQNHEQIGLQYSLSFLAVDRIAGRDWELALEFYRSAVARPVPEWKPAFTETFGMSPSNFYADFSAALE